MNRIDPFGWTRIVLVALFLTAQFVATAWADGRLPGEFDLERSRTTDGAHYRISLASRLEPPPLNRMHGWEVVVTGIDGQPVRNVSLSFTGEMPGQQHELPTAPKVTRQLGEGRYLVEGVKFDRQGWWRIHIGAVGEGTRERVVFSIRVDTAVWADWADQWSEDERVILKSLWIGSLPPLPPDPSNKWGDDSRAADFGHMLFFDKRLSRDGTVACATCHVPALAFTDGRTVAKGRAETTRNAPTIVGVAYNTWFFWDGRKDSLWSQALGPFESSVEHGTSREALVDVVRRDPDYRRRYQEIFGELPAAGNAKRRDEISRAFANLGKAIAAYERKLLPGPAKFDRYVEAVLANRTPAPEDRLSPVEWSGLKAFIAENQGQCVRCHSGPLFSDQSFHNIASQLDKRDAEASRAAAIPTLLADDTNCAGPYSDAPKQVCSELKFIRREGPLLLGAFKTPTLRFLPRTGPYMHAGQKFSLNDVMWHYRDAPGVREGTSELQQLNLAGDQFDMIEAFLKTLDGPINAPARYLRPPD